MIVRKSESSNFDDAQETRIPSALFKRYADEDLDRWRQLIGHQVQHADPRWGSGTVEAVSWGSPCDHVPAYVQVTIRYDAGWTVDVHSESWHEHHLQVSVPACVDAAIRQCLDAALSDQQQEACLAKHSRELRDIRDRELLDRAEKRRQSLARDGK